MLLQNIVAMVTEKKHPPPVAKMDYNFVLMIARRALHI